MRLIAHRGNLNGPNPLVENDPQRITYCIDEGYDVEIDVRYDHHTNMLWLGHDEPQYKITWNWIFHRQFNYYKNSGK